MDALLATTFIPDNDQQKVAYESPADELFFGGKAGTGKSWLLLSLAAFEHTNSVIFRREYAQHRGGDGLIAKSMELIGGYGDFNKSTGIWTEVFGRAIIELAGLENDKAVGKQKGRARDFYGFDEITEFTQDQYESVVAWNRTDIVGQRCRIVATGNPPTSAEGQWVTERWSPWLNENHPRYPYPPGKLLWYAQIDGKEVELESGDPIEHVDENGEKETIRPKSRTFIPGEMVSYLKRTDYEQTLQNLREPLRSKLLHGNFKAESRDDLMQVIPTAWIEASMARWDKSKKTEPLTCMGCDVSRGYLDKSVNAKRYGTFYEELRKYEGKDTADGPIVATNIMNDMEVPCKIKIDVGGIGSSPYDVLKDNDVDVDPINFGAGSKVRDRTGRLKMRNKRAELWWKFAEALDPENGHGIMLPPDQELKADLKSARFKITVGGVQIEDKKAIKARLGRSPDSGEAVILAWDEIESGAKIWEW
ncbi:MAG: terminase large subunit domain-containing protein [bacterium]